MPKIQLRGLAVLTVIALASFARAQNPETTRDDKSPFIAFKDNPTWTLADDTVTSSTTGIDKSLATRLTLADSVTSLP